MFVGNHLFGKPEKPGVLVNWLQKQIEMMDQIEECSKENMRLFNDLEKQMEEMTNIQKALLTAIEQHRTTMKSFQDELRHYRCKAEGDK